MKVTLLVLALNEIDGMKAIMPRVKKECAIIIILDATSDPIFCSVESL